MLSPEASPGKWDCPRIGAGWDGKVHGLGCGEGGGGGGGEEMPFFLVIAGFPFILFHERNYSFLDIFLNDQDSL